MRFRQPTAEQRRVVGELILLGNERLRLFGEALAVEQQLKEKVAEAFGDHAVPKRIIEQAASIKRDTVYRWLAAAGLHEYGREAQLKAEASEISGGDDE